MTAECCGQPNSPGPQGLLFPSGMFSGMSAMAGLAPATREVRMTTVAEPARKQCAGVLGGMGPAATLDFMAKVMVATPAAVDQDHIPLIVYQFPQIPSRTAAVIEGNDAPLQTMMDGVQALQRAGAEFIVIACNTAHHWFDALARSTRLEILHIADAVGDMLRERALLDRKIGLMATRATLRSHIFERRLPDVRFVTPSESTQIRIDEAIAAVKAGDLEMARDRAGQAARDFSTEGAEVLLLACTELPVALDRTSGLDWLDATEALAQACVARSLAGEAETHRMGGRPLAGDVDTQPYTGACSL